MKFFYANSWIKIRVGTQNPLSILFGAFVAVVFPTQARFHKKHIECPSNCLAFACKDNFEDNLQIPFSLSYIYRIWHMSDLRSHIKEAYHVTNTINSIFLLL
jgi:hypothetical protein